jgi:type IV pilus assembly protein PilN
MIRINLLAVERERPKRQRAAAGGAVISPAQRVTIGAGLILLSTVLVIAWWFWSLRMESARLDTDIAAAERETQKLRSVLTDFQKFEARRAQLQQRVMLIEQLRRGQTAPVHVLDEISKSLPDRLWLVTLTQHGDEFTIEGRATSLSSLTDFIANLENTNWFKRPVEILDSAVEPNPQTNELVRFTIRAWYNNPDAAPAAPAGRGRGAVPPAAH